jgi:hypothetical protein
MFRFFPACQVPEIILNESSKNAENAPSKRDHKIFYENQSIRGFFGFGSSSPNCYWNLFNTSVLSQICKTRNGWKLPSLFPRNTLIPSSEKCSWSLKTSFWKKNCPINSKNDQRKFLSRKAVNLWTSCF